MSIQAVSWALKFKAGSTAAKLVLISLANYADVNGLCWPSQSTIAGEVEMAPRTVRRVMADLEARGIIKREERRRPDGSRSSDAVTLLGFTQAANLSGGGDTVSGGADRVSGGGDTESGHEPSNNHQGTNKSLSGSMRSEKKATRLPEGWELPTAWFDDGYEQNLPDSEIIEQAERMANWSRGSPKNGAKLDWRATWRNWIKREAKTFHAKSSNTDRHRAGFQAALRGVDSHGQPLPQPGNDEPTSPAFRAALGLPH